MKRLLTFFILFLLISTTTACTKKNAVPAVKVPEKKLTASDYFPFEDKVTKTFKGSGNEYANYTTKVDLLNDNFIQIRTDNGGTQSVDVYTLKNDNLVRTYFEGEVYEAKDFTTSSNREEIVIRTPITLNDSWELDDASVRKVTGVDVDVTTPYGNSKALEISTTNEYSTVQAYYVKDIGLVKTKFVSKEDTSFVVTSELSSIVKK